MWKDKIDQKHSVDILVLNMQNMWYLNERKKYYWVSIVRTICFQFGKKNSLGFASTIK